MRLVSLQQTILQLSLLLLASSYYAPNLAQAESAVGSNFEGRHIKGDLGDTIYLVLDQKLRPIASPAVFEALFGKGKWKYEKVPQALVDNFPKGFPMDQTAPLIKGDGPTVYLVDERKKRGIASPEAFNRYGFSWDVIRSIGSAVDLIPDGPIIE